MEMMVECNGCGDIISARCPSCSEHGWIKVNGKWYCSPECEKFDREVLSAEKETDSKWR
jgi:hypothetical protein